jgi:hypothetical protein
MPIGFGASLGGSNIVVGATTFGPPPQPKKMSVKPARMTVPMTDRIIEYLVKAEE